MLEQFGLEKTKASFVRVGETFGNLKVVETGQIPGAYRYLAVCACSCGSPLKAIRFDALQSGATVSCGCIQKERTTTHGLSKSVHYHRWSAMMDRCYNPGCSSWDNYGGRGISVHPAWHDLATFIRDLPDGYRPGLEIDRINNDGHYEPGNVRWATRKVNSSNRRTARILTLNGKTQSMEEWSTETGMPASMIYSRIADLGWTVERALTAPIADRSENMVRAQKMRWVGHTVRQKPEPRIEKTFLFQGSQRTIAEIAGMTGISKKLLRKRLCERGWAVEKATQTE
jgi:hypothetical protein